jgi:D-alanine--poly(phosphoribitol) ligase subunit 1
MKNHSDLQELQDFLRAALCDPASPQQLAISGSDEALSWLQLSAAVTDWAQRYQRCQPVAGTPVVLYGHQQAEFAVAIYSCLLHNIPYIPVDCIYPQERLREICHLASAPYYYDVATRQFIATGNRARYWRSRIWPTSCLPQAAPVNLKACRLGVKAYGTS